jgi:DNA-binding HxlR family transcriptional regulator
MTPRTRAGSDRPAREGAAARGTSHTGCQVSELFAVLGRPHMLQILYAFEASGGAPLRFSELQSQLGISPKTLSSRLRTLVEGGFLTRRAFNEIPPRVEYQPSPKTAELSTLFDALGRWAERNTVHQVPMVTVVGRVPA